ncbi:MAG TPA: Ig-like domain-containing protein [Gemmatimonadaceae bacterium]|nr:Ig-like domain-containing protein [Gemmatimonadaceae bacterium]
MHMRTPTLLFSLAAVALTAACHKDSTGELPTTPSTPSTPGSSTSSSGLTITADTGLIGDTVLVTSVLQVKVHVTQNNTPVSGTAVTWTVSSGGGSVSAPSSTTDASGAAVVTWTIGDTARTNALSAGITGATVAVTVTAIGGKPTQLLKVTADSSAVVSGAALLLVARATDKFGNAAPGVAVTWSASGGTLSTPTSTTGLSGNASVNFVTPAKAGTSTVTASVAGLGSVTFKVVGL